MYSTTFFRVALLCLPFAALVAQQPKGVPVPVGTRVKAEAQAGGQTVEGALLSWRGDSLVLRADEPVDIRGNTIRLTTSSLRGVRLLESPPLWRYATTSNINFYTGALVPRPGDIEPSAADTFALLLLVATQGEFAAVDPATGTTVWARKDLPDLKGAAVDVVGAAGVAVVTRGEKMEIIDLRTGETRWDTGALSLVSARGWLPVPGPERLVLMYGKTADSTSTLIAAELGSGRVRWRQERLFTVEPKVFETQGASYLLGHQPPVRDSDTTLVLYLSTEGPVRLDARTGAMLWRGGSLAGAKVPAVRDGYARILHHGSWLFVPWEKNLVALRLADGHAAWDSARLFKNRVIRMDRTRRGLLVRGEDWMDLLDPASGRSSWQAPVALKNSTRIVLTGDTVYVAADKNVLAIQIPDGSVRTLATVKFKGGEEPAGISVFQQGIVLNSWHNLVLVDRLGAERYRRFYPSPGESFAEAMRRAYIGTDTRRPTTVWVGAHVHFFTGEPDEAGRKGFSLVKFDPARGREDGRIWFDERLPDYLLESAAGKAYYKREARELVALTFLDPAALAHAARNGHTTLAGKLLDMGTDVNAADGDGWTALHLAARAGHSEIVKLLLGRGAALNAKAEEHWSAWMLAAAHGHAEVVQMLRRAGAEYNDAVATLLRGWRSATRGEVDEALAAYSEAQAQDSTLALFPSAVRALCWNGSLWGQAAKVMPACDQAARLTPESNPRYASVLFARGLARALTGQFAGAAADLEPSLDPEADREDSGNVQEWIDALREGRNPFTPAVVESLRHRQ